MVDKSLIASEYKENYSCRSVDKDFQYCAEKGFGIRRSLDVAFIKQVGVEVRACSIINDETRNVFFFQFVYKGDCKIHFGKYEKYVECFEITDTSTDGRSLYNLIFSDEILNEPLVEPFKWSISYEPGFLRV